MSHRGPRVAAGLILLAAILGSGRWLAEFFAQRWWALGISPDAGVAVTRRMLAGLVLDLTGFTLALSWFGLHARWLQRAVRELAPDEPGGNRIVRRALLHPQAWFWLGVGALLLALLVGTGASAWIDALSLPVTGLVIGLAEPALGRDAGELMSGLPLWLRLQTGAALLILTAVAAAAGLHLASGTIRLGRGRLAITGQARLQLGWLLAVLALLLGGSRLLAPLELAAGIPFPVIPGVVQLHRTVALFLAGLALATAGISALWGYRPVHSLIAGSWFILSAGLVGAEALLPMDRPDFRDPDAAATLQRFEAVGYGVAPHAGLVARQEGYSLWDAGAVLQVVGLDTVQRMRVVPATILTQGGLEDGWAALGPGAGRDRTPLFVIPDRQLAPGGRPGFLPRAGASLDTARASWSLLSRGMVRPGAPEVEIGEEGGVLAGGVMRRVLLAWALQDMRLIVAAPTSRVAWHLTPEARLRQLAPWALWTAPRALLTADGVRWVVDGYSLSDAYPMARRREFHGQQVTYVRAGFVGVIEPRSGLVTMFLRPGADSLSEAWARASRGLVRPTAQMPDPVRRSLGYPRDLLPFQAELVGSGPTAQLGPDEALVPANTEEALPGPAPGSLLAPLVDVASARVRAVLVGAHRGGRDSLWLVGLDSLASLEGAEVLARQWLRLPLMQAVRDSVLATGGAVRAGRVRYALGEEGAVAWQPVWTGRTSRELRLAVVGAAQGDRFGAGRDLPGAWAALAGRSAGTTGLSGPMAALDEARRWSQVADSALRIGDLVTFGRAFAALRAALQRDPPDGP